MLAENPKWTFRSRKPLTQWYGHVHLLPDHVLGQWFCATREAGTLVWQRDFWRPNTVCEVEETVVVATETRADGPWTLEFGCYGISLEEGRLLWTSHGSGWRRCVGRAFDFIPGFTNEFRDTPHHASNGKIYCSSGRVLDVRTGKTLDRVDPATVIALKRPDTLARQLYDAALSQEPTRVRVDDRLALSPSTAKERRRGDWEIIADDDGGSTLWSFSIRQLDRHIDGNFHSYRLAIPYLYLVVSEEPRYRPHSKLAGCVEPNPTHWWLTAIDIRNGRIVQDLSLGPGKQEECRIEDVDDRSLLLGKSNRELLCFDRMQ